MLLVKRFLGQICFKPWIKHETCNFSLGRTPPTYFTINTKIKCWRLFFGLVVLAQCIFVDKKTRGLYSLAHSSQSECSSFCGNQSYQLEKSQRKTREENPRRFKNVNKSTCFLKPLVEIESVTKNFCKIKL